MKRLIVYQLETLSSEPYVRKVSVIDKYWALIHAGDLTVLEILISSILPVKLLAPAALLPIVRSTPVSESLGSVPSANESRSVKLMLSA